MRIGIFGGSFNPVHRGHVRLAEYAFSELNLDHVYFVPSCQTPLKSEKSLLPAELRVKLLKKALKGHPDFSVSTCEIDRGGKSYTVDTLRYFHKKSGSAAKIYFLTGMDSLENLSRWKSVGQIFKLCHFVAATRPGYRQESTKFPVIALPFEALDVSSSQIRSRLKSGGSLEELVPEGTAVDLKKYYQSAHKRGKKGVRTSKPRKS